MAKKAPAKSEPTAPQETRQLRSDPSPGPILLPKYKPGEAGSSNPFGTSDLASLAVQPSYQQMRDSAPTEAKALWNRVDAQIGDLRAYYEQLKDDPRYADEYKAEQAWQRYEVVAEKVAKDKERLKAELHKQAASGERFSVPMPGQEPLVTNDTQKILAAQNEAARIVRRIDRMDAKATSAKGGKSPFKPDWAEVCRDEYKKGLDLGGVQGGIICRGALAAAEEVGVDRDSVVDPFRKERHRENLERSQHALRLLDLISKDGPPEPPFAKPGQRRGRGSEPPRRGGTILVDRGEQKPIMHGRKRRPSWK